MERPASKGDKIIICEKNKDVASLTTPSQVMGNGEIDQGM
jgi:hypothetical protein